MRCDCAGSRTGLGELVRTPEYRTILRVVGVAAVALTVANCSSRSGIDPKYGVAPSPKVVADGQPIPKGGGRRMVGKPYVVAGRLYKPSHDPDYVAEGLASWYGPKFHGRMTANGEIFDRASIAAAHTTMPLPSYARVTNLQNGHSMIVRVNDRGPFHANRIIDVSERAAQALGFKNQGTARVRVEYVARASTNGSDDRILLASLRTDGQPATLTNSGPTMIAQAEPQSDSDGEASAARASESEEIVVASNDVSAAPEQAEATALPVAGYVPLPPERPFDLGTIPSAATPVSPTRTTPMAQPAAPIRLPSHELVAGLSYVPSEEPPSGFRKSSAFDPLDRSHFVMR